MVSQVNRGLTPIAMSQEILSSSSGSQSVASSLTVPPADIVSSSSTKKGKGKGKGRKFVPLDIWGASASDDMTPDPEYASASAQGGGLVIGTSSAFNGDFGGFARFGGSRFPHPRNQPIGTRHQITQSGGRNDISRQMENLSFGENQPGVKKPSAPLESFHLFANLPIEMRLKIWGLMCKMPRLLEVSWDFKAKDLGSKDAEHYYYRLAPRSCLPPALMHTNQEARSEAMRYYQQAVFTTKNKGQNTDSNYPASEPFETWYNPKADVVVFSENTCMNTILRFFQHQRLRNVQINNVAILLSGNTVNCHDWNRDDPIYGPDREEVAYGYAIAGGCTVMQALHGIHKDVAWTDMASGVKGLKEVFFIVPTFLTPIEPGTIDDSIWFRRLTCLTDGMTSGQYTIKKRMEQDVQLV
ncbi:hypothetical protein BDZ45DRAFT_420251 [Acephala macrosclerotiorum]|nr:hypothetical protein BDZ45DRAFT_420251 [Acephala macrosclerotiorum]